MKYFRYLVTFSYAALIFYLSSRSWMGGPQIPHLDKIAHFILYLGLGGFVVWALRTTRLRYRSSLIGVAFFLTALYGLSDEIHQLYVPGREFSMGDLLADAAGALMGVLIAARLAKYLRKEGEGVGS